MNHELIAAGHDPEIVEQISRLLDLSEYKRRQSPLGPKVSKKAFGRDRRLPITNYYSGENLIEKMKPKNEKLMRL